MRVLRLDTGEVTLEFHPYLTVVTDLDDAQRSAVIESFAAIAEGRAVGRGLVEAHGIVFDLDDDTLALLEIGGLESSPVVTIDDLPGRADSSEQRAVAAAQHDLEAAAERVASSTKDAEADEREQREAAVALEQAERVAAEREDELAEHRRVLDDVERTRADLAVGVDDARRALETAEDDLAEARAAVADAEQHAADARSARDASAAEGSALAGRLEAVESALDVEATADVEAAERAAEEAAQALEDELSKRRDEQPADGEPREAVETRLARLEVERTDLDARIAVLGGADTAAVRAALEMARADRADERPLVRSAEAMALAAELAEAEQALADRPAPSADDGGALVAARERLDAARRALADAEHQVRLPDLDRDDVDALELAHADVLEAQDKADGRFSGSRAERRLEEARAAEREVLERLGFESYADYMMGTSILHVDDEREAMLDAARAELADAEDAWAALQVGVDVELEHAAALDRVRVLRQRAVEMLDGDAPDDLVGALEAVRVPAELDGDGHVRLANALEVVGLAVAHEDLDPIELELIAEEWLEAEELASEEREAVLAERAEVDLQIAEAVSQLSRAAAGAPGPSEEERLRARADDARAAVQAARERLRRHEEAANEVDELRATLTDVRSRAEEHEAEVRRAVERHDEAASRLAEVEAGHDEARRRLAAAEQALADFEQSLSGEHLDELERAVAAAAEVVQAAQARLDDAENALAARRRQQSEALDELRAAEQAVEAAETALAEATGEAVPTDEIEWYLLGRLAAQRRVSFAGSIPLLVDRALEELPADVVTHVLERLERMVAAVQLVVVSDHQAVLQWAADIGELRGAIAAPERATAASASD